MKEIEPPLWNRENEQVKPRVDVFHTQVSQLTSTIERARRYKVLRRHEDGARYTPIAHYDENGRTVYEGYPEAIRAEAHVKKDTDTIFLAVDHFDVEHEMRTPRYYSVLPNGTVLDLDMDLAAIDSTSDDYASVKQALERVNNSTEASVERKVRILEKRRARARAVALGSASVAVVSGLAVFGARKLIFEPAEAAQAYRIAFDQHPHDVPGSGISIQRHVFGEVDPGTFQAIPDYGGNDSNFSEPRVISLDPKTGCDTVETKITGMQELHAALPSDSKYVNYHFTASSEQGGFTICLTEPLPSGGLDASVPVAVQIK